MRRAPSMKARYCSASLRIEIPARSTVCRRASSSRRSSGPSKPPTIDHECRVALARSSSATSSSKRSSLIHSPARPNRSTNLDLSAGSRKQSIELAPSIHRIERLRRVPNSRECRFGPAASLPGERPRRAGDGLHLLTLPVAVQHDIATGGVGTPRPLGERAGKRLHGEVVGHDEPLIADVATNDFLEHDVATASPDGGRRSWRRRHGPSSRAACRTMRETGQNHGRRAPRAARRRAAIPDGCRQWHGHGREYA